MPSFIKNVSILTFGTVLSQSLTIVTAPILTRLFAPEAFGVLGLFATFAGIIGVFACMQFESAMIIPDMDSEAASIFIVAVLCIISITLITLFFTYLFKDVILHIFNAEALGSYVFLLSPMVFFFGLFQIFNYWHIRIKHFKTLSFVRVINSIFSNLFKLIMGYLGHVSGGILIAAVFVGAIASNTVSMINICKNKNSLFSDAIKRKKLIPVIKKYRRFPQFLVWSVFLIELSHRLPVIFIAAFYSSYELGLFVVVQIILKIPLNTFGNSLALVFFQKAPGMQKDKAALVNAVEKIFSVLVSLSFFPVILLIIFGKDFFSFIFGRSWLEAGIYAQVLSVSIMVDFFFTSVLRLFDILHKQKESLIFDILLCLTISGCMLVGGLLNNIYFTLIYYVIGDSVIRILKVYFIVRIIGFRVKSFFISFAKLIIYTFPFLICLFMMKWLITDNVSLILVLSFFLTICCVVLNLSKIAKISLTQLTEALKD